MPAYISVKDVATNYRLMIPFHGEKAFIVAFQKGENLFGTLSLYDLSLYEHNYYIFSNNIISSDEVMESFYKTMLFKN